MQDIALYDALIELESYELKEIIGQGSFGIVFKAIEKATGQIVALKVIQKSKNLDDKKEQTNILREITVPRILNLPGIVKLLGFRFPLTDEGMTPDKLLSINAKDKYNHMKYVDLTGAIIVTELMKNGSLDSYVKDYLDSKGMKNEVLNPTVRTKILFGIAATMKQVHKRNVIHRDLKLENVFLDDNKEPRIADFGLAKVMVNKVDMTMVVGTPFYMAPEIFADGEETYTVSVDVYAFAFVMYKMFSNLVQFADLKAIRSPQQYLRKIEQGQRPLKPASIPEPYWELIQKCWDQNPSDRPTFEQITEYLRDDKYAINEFEMTTDLDELHEYQSRIDEDDSEISIDFSKSTIIRNNDKNFLMKSRSKIKITPEVIKTRTKTKFNWKRH